jgi:hypothetical protein
MIFLHWQFFSEGGTPEKLTFADDITKLVFYKLGEIFVLKDKGTF